MKVKEFMGANVSSIFYVYSAKHAENAEPLAVIYPCDWMNDEDVIDKVLDREILCTFVDESRSIGLLTREA